VASVIETMDEYFLNREDWDSIVDLGVGEYKADLVTKKIPTATKSAFTRMFVFFAFSFRSTISKGVLTRFLPLVSNAATTRETTPLPSTKAPPCPSGRRSPPKRPMSKKRSTCVFPANLPSLAHQAGRPCRRPEPSRAYPFFLLACLSASSQESEHEESDVDEAAGGDDDDGDFSKDKMVKNKAKKPAAAKKAPAKKAAAKK
jgi:hypothetical protein